MLGDKRCSTFAVPGARIQVVVLMSVLARYAAWSGSTCGVERAFTLAQWAVEGRKSWASDALETDEMKLLVDRWTHEDDVVVSKAREVWKWMKYGKPRAPYE
jgi:hypothetical protein